MAKGWGIQTRATAGLLRVNCREQRHLMRDFIADALMESHFWCIYKLRQSYNWLNVTWVLVFFFVFFLKFCVYDKIIKIEQVKLGSICTRGCVCYQRVVLHSHLSDSLFQLFMQEARESRPSSDFTKTTSRTDVLMKRDSCLLLGVHQGQGVFHLNYECGGKRA